MRPILGMLAWLTACGATLAQHESAQIVAPSKDASNASADNGVPSGEAPAPSGLLPIPDYLSGIQDRKYLLGDWGGTRTDLARHGLTLDLSFTQVVQGVVDGGRDRRWAYGGKVDAILTFDLQRMGVLPGALVTARTESRYGESVNHDAGTLLPVNDVMYFPLTDEEDDGIPITVTELRYVQFLSPQFGLFVGKFTTLGGDSNEFAAGRGDTQFLSHPFLSASVTALVNPYSTLGAGVIINPIEQIAITSSLYSAADSSTTTGFGTLGDGWVSSSSIRGQYRLGTLPGGMMVTAQYAFDNDFVNFRGQFIPPDNGRLPRTQDSWNVFWNAWQYLYVEEPSDRLVNVTDGRTDLQGVGLFARAATADRDTNPVKWVISGGVAGKGVFPSRDNDTFGIGYAYSDIQDAPFVTGRLLESSSARFEAYYTIAVTPAAEITFDAQWADSILAGTDPAWLLGVRVRLSF